MYIHTHIGIGIDHNSTLFLSAFGMRLGAQISFTPKRRVTYHGTLLRCQHLYFCTGEASKLELLHERDGAGQRKASEELS